MDTIPTEEGYILVQPQPGVNFLSDHASRGWLKYKPGAMYPCSKCSRHNRIGQDLFSNRDLYSAMMPTSIVLKSRAAKHSVSFIGVIHQDQVYICNRVVPSGRLTLEASHSVVLKPRERKKGEVKGEVGMKIGNEIEIGPLEDEEGPLRVIPSVNCFLEQRTVVMVENKSEQSVVINQGQAVCQILGSNVHDDYSLVAEVSGDIPLESETSRTEGPQEINDPEKPHEDMERGLGMCINKLWMRLCKTLRKTPGPTRC